MNVFKMEQNLSITNGVADVKVTTPELTFDTSSDFSLAFFDASTPPPPVTIKKEPDFDDRMFDSVAAPDSLFSPSSEYSSFTGDEAKYSSFNESGSNYHDSNSNYKDYNDSGSTYLDSSSNFLDSSSSLSPVSTPTVSSPLPSPGITNSSSKPSIIIKTEQSFQVADSTPASSPSPHIKNAVPCKVCGDKASGYHYGVTSCEGCKGFFRRSIQKQIEYRCLRDGKCHVIRLNRNRCQFCRFKKCLAVGMSRDSVRYGRVPKRTREREGSSDSRGPPEGINSEPVISPSDSRQLGVYDVILTISSAHHANCAYTEEMTRSLVRKHIDFNSSDVYSDPEAASSTVETLEQQKINGWHSFAVFVTPSIQRVVEFSKRVPGFAELSQDDQLMLIKGGFFELWLIRVSRLISNVDNTLTFSDGSYLTRHQLELMFEQQFVSSLFNFALTFNNLSLNDNEIGLFSAIVLLNANRAGVTDTKAVEQYQDKIVEAVRIQLERNHPSDNHLFTNLAMKLPELKQIGSHHNEHLNWFRSNWARLKLPPLFAEIFDIPKCEEDLL